MANRVGGWLLGALLAAAAAGPLALTLAPDLALAEEAKVHVTRGAIKSIAPDRKVVHIAHEEIPGFMGAMTMSFEARAPEQLAGLAVGDVVDFSFTVTPEGRRVIVSITKRAP